jgi:hypothetical protein
MSELCEKAWRNCVASDKYDIDDLFDLLASIEQGLEYNPHALGTPHPNHEHNGLWVYNSPPLIRFPTVYVLYEIDEERKLVIMWASHFAN